MFGSPRRQMVSRPETGKSGRNSRRGQHSEAAPFAVKSSSYRARCNARMPCSNPSSVSGYMRSPISSRTIWIDGT